MSGDKIFGVKHFIDGSVDQRLHLLRYEKGDVVPSLYDGELWVEVEINEKGLLERQRKLVNFWVDKYISTHDEYLALLELSS